MALPPQQASDFYIFTLACDHGLKPDNRTGSRHCHGWVENGARDFVQAHLIGQRSECWRDEYPEQLEIEISNTNP